MAIRKTLQVLFSFALGTLCMLLITDAAYGEELWGIGNTSETTYADGSVDDSLDVNDVTASLDPTGTLTIMGLGDADLKLTSDQKKQIRKVVIGKEVEPLSMRGWFEGCLILESIEFTISTKTIDVSRLFKGCESLTVLPEDFSLPRIVVRKDQMFYLPAKEAKIDLISNDITSSLIVTGIKRNMTGPSSLDGYSWSEDNRTYNSSEPGVPVTIPDLNSFSPAREFLGWTRSGKMLGKNPVVFIYDSPLELVASWSDEAVEPERVVITETSYVLLPREKQYIYVEGFVQAPNEADLETDNAIEEDLGQEDFVQSSREDLTTLVSDWLRSTRWCLSEISLTSESAGSGTLSGVSITPILILPPWLLWRKKKRMERQEILRKLGEYLK